MAAPPVRVGGWGRGLCMSVHVCQDLPVPVAHSQQRPFTPS